VVVSELPDVGALSPTRKTCPRTRRPLGGMAAGWMRA